MRRFILNHLRNAVLITSLILTSASVQAKWMGPEYLTKLNEENFVISFRNSCQTKLYSKDYKLLKEVSLPGTPTGMTACNKGEKIFVTLNDPDTIVVIDAASFKIVQQTSALPGVCSPLYDAELDRLYLCNRWHTSVSALDVKTMTPLWNTRVEREPGSSELDVQNGILYVPNRQTTERVDGEEVHTLISLLDVKDNGKNIKTITMPSGCADYRGMAISPDGKKIAVVHNLAKFFQSTFQVEWAWMNSSYVTFFDTERRDIDKIIPLDNVIRGAASPWNLSWTPDGETLLVSHAGVHEMSVINLDVVQQRLEYQGSVRKGQYFDQQEALAVGRERIQTGGNGPRSFIQMGNKVIVGNFFSDNLGVIDLANSNKLEVISLNPEFSMTQAQEGEMYFNDAMLCVQNWQSCIGCHPDGRADGFNWDLMNDGLDTFKNTKSLLYSHYTPPSMITGIRPNAEYAVRSGIRAILFTQVIEEQALAMDEYLKSLRPVPSPYLVNGELSEKAKKGREIFRDHKVGCTLCHHGDYFTDMRLHDVKTYTQEDFPLIEFDTPTLIEVWRTAPYLHDGSAPTIMDVLTTRNKEQAHGHTEHLTQEELEALAEYVLSL